MIKVSKLADYAVVILSVMDGQQANLMSASEIATMSRLPEPTVAKILKLLTQGQVLSSVRGASGGYSLARASKEITLVQVICAIDGPIALTACVGEGDPCCDYTRTCPVKGRWDGVNEVIRGALSNISVADLIEGKIYAKAS